MQKKVVLVTGGTKGIGKGIAQCFLEQGATVVVCGRSEPESLPQAGAGSSVNTAGFVSCDVRDLESLQSMVDGIVSQHGRLDVLINNAGGAPHADAATASPRFHESIIRLNLLAPFNLAQIANRVMQQQDGGGSIVFTGSVSALRPSPGTAAYGAAKAGVLSLVESLAVEWAPRVRLMAVSPGPVQTEQSHLHFGDEAGVAAVGKTIPMGRMALPEDIGNACVFFASERAAYLTGANLVIHGGGEKPAFLAAANADHSSNKS